MKDANHVLMEEFSEGKPRTTSKSYKPPSLKPFIVCLVVTGLSLLTFYALGFFSTTSAQSELLQAPKMCDACTLNTDVEDYVTCRTCEFTQEEDKVLKCPNGKTDVKILSARIGGVKSAEAQAMIYQHCQETWQADDADWDCVINFSELMQKKKEAAENNAVDGEPIVEPVDAEYVDVDPNQEQIIDDPYDPYVNYEEKEVTEAPQMSKPQDVTPEDSAPKDSQDPETEYVEIFTFDIEPMHPARHPFFDPMDSFLDPTNIIRDILEPQELPMGPVLEATQHMYAAQLFGSCPDNKRPGCYLTPDQKSKPTKCKNHQDEVVDMNRGSWPPCPHHYHPACEDGTSLVCSDGSEPARPQLCSTEGEVPVCKNENEETAPAECKHAGKEPQDFFCGKYHPAKCPDGFTATCSDGPAVLPRRGGKGKGRGKGKGKGKGKGNRGKGRNQGQGRNQGRRGKGKGRGNRGQADSDNVIEQTGEQSIANEPFLSQWIKPPPGKGMKPAFGPFGHKEKGGFPHHKPGFPHHHKLPFWDFPFGKPEDDQMMKIKYMCISTAN